MSAVLATLIVYKLVLLGVGLYVERRNRDVADFFLASRGLGPWVAGISASASSSSVWTLIGVSAYAYANGLSAAWLFPSCVGGFALNWYVLAPRLRRLTAARDALTVTELLADAPANSPSARLWIRRVASAIVLVSLVTYVANQFRGAGTSFEELLAWNATESVLLGAAVVIAYTMLGGFWAVSVTDTIQGLMMALAAVVLPVAALVSLGGPTALWDGMAAVGGSGDGTDAGTYTSVLPSGGVLAAGALLGIGLGYPGQPHVVNRLMALRDDRALAHGRAIAMSWAALVYAGMLVLGWSGRVLAEGGALGDGVEAEKILFTLASYLLPAVVAGVAIAAVLSAIMSTADSQLLVAASAVDHDLGGHGTGAESHVPTKGLLRARLTVLVLAAVSVVAALVLTETIFRSVLFAWGAIGAAFGPLLLVTLFRGPVRAQATLAAMLLGFGLSVAAYSRPETRGSAFERVLPYLVAGVVAWTGVHRPAASGSVAPRDGA